MKKAVKKDYYYYLLKGEARKYNKNYVMYKIGETDNEVRDEDLIRDYTKNTSKLTATMTRIDKQPLPMTENSRVNDKAIHNYIKTHKTIFEPVDPVMIEGLFEETDGATEFFKVVGYYSDEEIKEALAKIVAILKKDPSSYRAGRAASTKNSLNKTNKQNKNVCKPIPAYGIGQKIFNMIKNSWSVARLLSIRKISVQSIWLADKLSEICPHAEIRVVIVGNDRFDNKSLYDIISTDKNGKFEICICDTDAHVEDLYMNDTKDFDLIIANPPYDRATYAEILNTVLINNQHAAIKWLAPEGLVTTGAYVENPTGDANIIIGLRKRTEDRLYDYYHWGSDFGGYTLPLIIGIYSYDSESSDYTYADAYKYLNELCEDPVRRSVLEKIKSAPKIRCSYEGINFGYKADPTGVKKSKTITKKDADLDELMEKMNAKHNLPSDKRFGIYTVGAIKYAKNRPIAWKSITRDTFYQQTGCVIFDDAAYCETIYNNVCKREFAYILKLSSNGDAVTLKPYNWPESFEACGFTEEEKAWLKSNFEAKN